MKAHELAKLLLESPNYDVISYGYMGHHSGLEVITGIVINDENPNPVIILDQEES